MFCSPVGGRNHTNANGSSTFRFQVNSCYLCEFCFFRLSVSVFLFLCAFWSVQWVSYCHGDRLVLFIVCRLTGGLYNAAIIFATEIFVWIFMFSAHTHTTKWWKFGFQMQITAVGRNWIIIKDYWIGFFVDKCSCSKTNPTKCVTKLVFCFSTISFYVYFFLLQRLW